MNKIRQEAISTIKAIKPAVIKQQKEERKGQKLYGEYISLHINGKERTLYYFASGKENAPVYFDIHGGGFAWGSIEDGNFYCNELSKNLKMNVYSLDYPLSPENVYPSQLDYLAETITYLIQHAEHFGIDPTNIYIGGRSAGANLAAALCIRAINQKDWCFRAQILDHPWLDLEEVIPDQERYIPEGFNFNVMDNLRCLGRAYADVTQRKTADCSPIAADKNTLALLPPAIIQTCELDNLRNDGDLYAQLLKDAGVTVIHRTAQNVGHGFTEQDTPDGAEGRKWLIDALRNFVSPDTN